MVIVPIIESTISHIGAASHATSCIGTLGGHLFRFQRACPLLTRSGLLQSAQPFERDGLIVPGIGLVGRKLSCLVKGSQGLDQVALSEEGKALIIPRGNIGRIESQGAIKSNQRLLVTSKFM